MTKYCPVCKETKPIDQFAKHKSRPDGLQSMCKACQHNHAKVYFQNNKAKFNELNRQNRVKKRLAIEEYKKDKVCVDCDNNNPVVLTFDHVRGKKVAAIPDMANRSFTLAAIYKEIAKCEMRCFNCHMIKDRLKCNITAIGRAAKS
jgi:hypothetical protein